MAETSVEAAVVYVVADPNSPDGFRKLGTYRMLVPPRINETVTIAEALGGKFGRYQVLEVIHNMPAPGFPDILTESVVLLRGVFTPGDRERALANLCRRDDHTGRSMIARTN